MPSAKMIVPAKCANRDCSRRMQTYVEGRLFQFEVVSISLAANDEALAPFDEKPERETVLFWLCGACAPHFNLALEPAHGLRLVPVTQQNECRQEQAWQATGVLQ